VTCNGSDPDNDPLTYSYTATGGQITGTGSSVQFDSTGARPGTYTVTANVNDGAEAPQMLPATVEVKEPPQVKQLEAKLALHSIYFPTAMPTVAKPMGGLLPSQAATLDALASDFKQYLNYRQAAHPDPGRARRHSRRQGLQHQTLGAPRRTHQKLFGRTRRPRGSSRNPRVRLRKEHDVG